MGDNSGVDWWQAGLDFYNYNQSQDAISDSENDIQEGFQMQNPWSQHQPAMGAGLMQLLANPGSITETPGYQFNYDQGLQALFAKQASTGNRFSGRALNESMQFGQGLASQMYNSEMDRYAKLAGAWNPVEGGVTTGEHQSALNQQGSFNQGNFLNSMLANFSNNNTNVASQGNTPNWLDPYTNVIGRDN